MKKDNVTTFDIEATHLYEGIPLSSRYDKNGRYILEDIEYVNKQYRYTDILQFGISNGDRYKHTTLKNTYSQSIPKIDPKNTVMSKMKFKDSGIDVAIIKQTQITQDQINTLLQSTVRNKHKLNWYTQNVTPYFVSKGNTSAVIMERPNGKFINMSYFSAQKFAQEYDDNAIRKASSKLGVEVSEMDFDDFIKGKQEGSLFHEVSSLLTKSNKETQVLQAWNIAYDINFIRSVLYRNGHQELVSKFDDAVKTGRIAIKAVEHDWQLIAYNIIKAHPEMASKIRIGFNPLAMFDTHGKSGSVVSNFLEFQHSNVKWSQEAVSTYLRFIDKIKGTGDVLHLAGTDTKMTSLLAESLEGIKHRAAQLAREKGISFTSIDELARSGEHPDIFVNAIEELTSKKNGFSATKLASEITEDAVKASDYYKKTFPSFFSNETKILKKNGYLRMGVTAAGALGILGYSYISTKDDMDVSKFTSWMSFKKDDNKSSINEALERDGTKPNYSSHFFKTVIGTAAFGAGATFVAGWHYANKSPQLFGVRQKEIEGIADAAKAAVKTMRFGLSKLEASFPILRALNMTSTIDYLSGTKRPYFIDGRGEVIAKKQTFKIFSKDKIRVTTEFNDLLEFTKSLHPEKYERIKKLINPIKITRNVDTRVVKVYTNPQTNQTVLDIFDTTVDGVKKQRDSITLDIKTKVVDTRKTNPLAREAKNRKRKVRPIENHLIQLDAERSSARLRNFAKIVKKKEELNGIGDNKALNTMYKRLEGLREKLDIYHKHENITAKKIVRVTGLTDPLSLDMAKLSLSAKAKFRTFSRIGKSTIFPIDAMNKFMDSPFELLGVDASKLKRYSNKLKESDALFKNVLGKALSFIHTPNLGLNVNTMKYGVPQYMLEVGVKRILPAYLAYQAFMTTDKLLGSLTFSNTGRGPLTGIPINMYQGASLLYAKTSDILGLTNIAKRQETVAPGSTGLGFFAPGLSLYTSYRFLKFMKEKGPEPVQKTITGLFDKFEKSAFMKTALAEERIAGTIERGFLHNAASFMYKKPFLGIMAASMIPMMPFIPGFLGSNKSYEERKAEYNGDKEVAIRKNRGWLLSSQAFGGGKVTQYRRHASNLIENNWIDQGVMYPSKISHALHSLTFGLWDRYILEKYHEKSQPVYQSAAYGSNVPFLGGIISATIGRIIKPTETYHTPVTNSAQGKYNANKISFSNSETLENMQALQIEKNEDYDLGVSAPGMELENQNSMTSKFSSFQSSFSNFAGLKGFIGDAFMADMTGKKSLDYFTPYAQSSESMYNPSNFMWGLQSGDISIFGGEFLRRIFQKSPNKWEVNDIPNELMEANWIPHNNMGKDFTHGTTFNKVPMGWLYGSRKGWEWLYPEETRTVDGESADLNQYGPAVQTEILQQLAPSSMSFKRAAGETLNMALSNQLDPYQEQRYYDTLSQARELNTPIYATSGEYTYTLPTETIEDTVKSVNANNGSFTGESGKEYRLAGVSLELQDIRARLLKQKEYDSAERLDLEARSVQRTLQEAFLNRIKTKQKLSLTIASASEMNTHDNITEAIVEGLNEDLLEEGAPFANTGNLSTHNMAQDMVGIGGSAIADYWSFLTSSNRLANKKLISQRDYLSQYKDSLVYNKEIKRWDKPISDLVAPMITSTGHLFGVDIIPTFTKKRRGAQQYFDVIKYVKYKTLEQKYLSQGNAESANYFKKKYEATMVGADPTNNTYSDEYYALPYSERKYFTFFANEPDKDKRGAIYDILPAFSKRLYSGIWIKKLAESGDKDAIESYGKMKETKGYLLDKDEEELYQEETEGKVDKAEWARAHFVKEYINENPIPGADWTGWREDVDLDNVEVNALQESGDSIEDFGYFDEKARIAAYDNVAYAASLQLNSVTSNNESVTGTILPMLAGTQLSSARGMPTLSTTPNMSINITTNGYSKQIARKDKYNSLLGDEFVR